MDEQIARKQRFDGEFSDTMTVARDLYLREIHLVFLSQQIFYRAFFLAGLGVNQIPAFPGVRWGGHVVGVGGKEASFSEYA